jgi:hypothetical protein
MTDRARNIAAGFADVGLSRAEELLRRLSPEGREQARREKEARARRRKRLILRLGMALVATLVAAALLAAVVPLSAAFAAAAALMVLLTLLVYLSSSRPLPGREALTGAGLPDLAEEAIAWVAAQRRGLPPEALRLTNSVCGRLEALSPQLGRLDSHSPAASALRKLIGEELPNLVDGWRAVPISARGNLCADGRSSDDHLINGLQLIDAELARASVQFGRLPADEIAILGRYLELKYDDNGHQSRS